MKVISKEEKVPKEVKPSKKEKELEVVIKEKDELEEIISKKKEEPKEGKP